MPLNGSGSYAAPASSWNPAVTTTSINSTDWNALLSDLTTALSTALYKDGQQTPTANLPMGSFKLTGLGAGTAAGNSLRYEQLFTTSAVTLLGSMEWVKGADIASAATVNLTTATGNAAHITGTTPITAVTLGSGMWRMVVFDGALTLTHHTTNNNLPTAANITTAAGDRALYWADGTTTYCMAYVKANGRPLLVAAGDFATQTANTMLSGPTSGGAATPTFRSLVAADVVGLALNAGTSTVTTSGTSIDFTSTITSPKRVTISFVGVSTNGTDNWYVQVGPSGGVVSSGYLGASSTLAAGTATSNYTAAFGIRFSDATNPIHGSLTLTLENASTNTWAISGVLAQSGAAQTITVAGSIALSGTLNKLRLTTSGGVNTFDAGEMNVIWE